MTSSDLIRRIPLTQVYDLTALTSLTFAFAIGSHTMTTRAMKYQKEACHITEEVLAVGLARRIRKKKLLRPA